MGCAPLGSGGLDSDVYSLRSNSTRVESQAIVFAVTAWTHDRKCVDYYMTWRGKTVRTPLPLVASWY